MSIMFYSPRCAYGLFSNFARTPFEDWKTAEHCFQAAKFTDLDHIAKIRAAATPAIAKRLGSSHRVPLRPDWEAVKDDVMLHTVLRKFVECDEARDLLLSTGDAELVEHTKNDAYWGDGGGGGRNQLGKTLMIVRNLVRA